MLERWRVRLTGKARATRLLLAAALILGLGFGVERHLQTRRLARMVSESVDLAAVPPRATAPAVFDRLRAFVNDNGKQAIDAEYYVTNATRSRLFEAFLQTVKGQRNENPVHVDCFARTRIMAMMLEHLGFKTRRIDIYSTSLDLQSHTFLDVFNPESGRWETQHPAYDIYWTDAATGFRVSLAQRAGNISTILPCGRKGCDWDVKSRENFKASLIANKYFDVMVVSDKSVGPSFALHTPRAKISAKFTNDGRIGTFCELYPKKCASGLFAIDGPGPHRD